MDSRLTHQSLHLVCETDGKSPCSPNSVALGG